MIPLNHYLIVSGILFAIGAFGVLTRKNLLIIFLSVEIMLNAVNLSFVALSTVHHHLDGQIFSLFVIAIAAAEIAIGLALTVLIFKKHGMINPDKVSLMKW